MTIDTPLGLMIAIADQQDLHFLDFVDEPEIEEEILNLGLGIVPGKTEPLCQIEEELRLYFLGKLKTFQTPICLTGTEFQKEVWQELQKIPFGQTRSYKEIALAINNPRAIRAAASANGANPLPIIIPCHRVINTNGGLGGYSSGLSRKKWLLDHEGFSSGS